MTLEERREKMLQLVGEWQHSDQSQKSFAEARGINLFTFRYWINKQREHDEPSDSFLQLSASMGAAVITIRYPNGTELQMPASTSLAILKGLISL
ncbi:hypothetical protein MASR1M74_03390 [Lentimicrobium sp.]